MVVVCGTYGMKYKYIDRKRNMGDSREDVLYEYGGNVDRKLIQLTIVGTITVDVVSGVLSERHEQALEISVARNLLSSGGIETTAFAMARLSFCMRYGGGPSCILTVVLIVAAAESLWIY
jgi:hypothetical protein